jgi:hypothetical protein
MATAETLPPGQRDGELRQHMNQLQAWDAEQQQWLMPVEFWQQYAARRGGLSWGRGAIYPPYGEVKEHDTFMVETTAGPCLMEFFHGRWRRANDVRRWDTKFTHYAGCPHVFDE